MAHHLQRLTALLILGAALQAAPFSHKLHLKLIAQCERCHASAATSTKAEDNNLPKAEACLPCHAAPTIGEPRKLTVTRFNHQKHAAFSNIAALIQSAIAAKTYYASPIDHMPQAEVAAHLKTSHNACTACHRGIGQSEAPSPALHANMPDCLTCHSKIDNPFSCELCHSPGQNLKPASHTPDYVDRHSTGKLNLDKQSCQVCHGRRFQCLGCH